MASFYKYAIVRLAPDDARDERVNVGIAVFKDGELDVRVAKRIDKVRALSLALDSKQLVQLLENLRRLDEGLGKVAGGSVDERRSALARLGPLSLSELGTFVAKDVTEYDSRLNALVKHLVEPEAPPVRVREKRSGLLTQLKHSLRKEKVLAKRDEGLGSHRILTSYQLEEGLVADLILQNSAMHVVETVDATRDEESARKAIGDIAISAFVLETARLKFGENQTKARLVYDASARLEAATKPSLDVAEKQERNFSIGLARRIGAGSSTLCRPQQPLGSLRSVKRGSQTRRKGALPISPCLRPLNLPMPCVIANS